MWVIFFHDTPHFWLIGGETYRVGKKDCHVVILDDRSISRVHLTLHVGLPPLDGGPSEEERRDRSPSSTPQPITLTDSSTYGTAVAAAMEDVEEDEETQDSNALHGTTAALDTGIVGLRYAPSAVARGRSGSASHRSGSDKKTNVPPALQLTKGVPYDVPVHRASWRRFTIQLGHHGAALRLTWVDVAVLCEDIEDEMQTKLAHALRSCGVRREEIAADPSLPPPPLPPSSPHGTAENSSAVPQQQPLSRNTLSERSATGGEGVPMGARPLPAVLGGSGVLSLSQRTSVPATPSGSGPSPAGPSHPTQAFTVGMASTTTTAASCYNHVDFLVTSTVQPSTAVVGMLCRAVPIVSPTFFTAIRDRVSPQLPLPDPRRFTPPLSTWWRDLIQNARQASLEGVKAAAATSGSGSHTADTSATVSPSVSSVMVADPPVPTTTAGSTVQQAQLSAYFAPNPQRRELFRGMTFVVVQRVLYEEVMTYLDCTGATVVWEGALGDWVTPSSDGSAALSFSSQSFQEMQSFFARHQRHVVLYNETAEMPFALCLPVLQHALGLCSVEYGLLIESIVLVRAPPPLLLADYPDHARLPQTVEEVRARVRLALGEASSAHDSDTQDSEWNAGAQDEDTATTGRRTDAQPLFPDVAADTADGPPALHKGGQSGNDGLLRSEAHPHKRPRREDADGWVTLGKSAAVAAAATPHSGVAVPSGLKEREEGATGTARTVDVHFSPYALPPYPCFADTTAATTASTSANPAEQRKAFVKQALPPAEPLVELEEHRARRQLAASMLVARVPTVDADTVVPDQVVMGSSGSALQSREAALANAAFNTFDTVVHHASNRRRGTAARRGRGGGGASGSARTRSAPQTTAALSSSTAARPFVAATPAAVVDVDDVGHEVTEVGPRESTASSAFHIFDIDGIF
ncbi:hypothetical protein ABB37_01886 [Leptomonas pyrrhocoris]|uniref:FHA domain-containing protein n=1 Tax=Leptomonas pyrrhocoris TaxID=157538 RepID=A0A0M9G6S4_LEPPY|nr:hypothetical protein ABB37_01886 [Leptomonas pyrrhocoris]KPA83613.1 hypothetical protein ABB37_01886 [Leptomonas pyrrhocoris]|eukprot:XP_015662052.1 hypothetical protein ABB37_01886 [Leptomonas pyrrhocoris]